MRYNVWNSDGREGHIVFIKDSKTQNKADEINDRSREGEVGRQTITAGMTINPEKETHSNRNPGSEIQYRKSYSTSLLGL